MGVKNRLKEIRLKEYMMSSIEFAKLLGVTNTTYSNWELEKVKPTLDTALKVSKILNRTIEQIWYLDE
ncbi:hypothetical protein SDC9_111059 [bioreactor metagenome]|uniref:HTH cro/C1-type domain-containing protein n=1 Tax=bioreactor metagenome TaxID=1076179 RepID=A0A645BLN8_9ZZZZ